MCDCVCMIDFSWIQQGTNLWSVYGKSVTTVEGSGRNRFTATLNRAKVFEAAIARTLHCERQRLQSGIDPAVAHSRSDQSVLINCPLFSDDDDDKPARVVEATHLRQLFVAQHIHALLIHTQLVLVSATVNPVHYNYNLKSHKYVCIAT